MKANFLRKTSLNKEITFLRKVKSKAGRDKRGFLLGEYTLKIIIAVLSIILLLYLLFIFYSSFTEKQNFKRAESTLGSLDEKMIDAKSGEISLPLLEPNGWRLISYSGIEKPDACTENCICLCEAVETGKWKKGLIWADTQIEKCETRGVCKNFDEKINEFNIKIRTDVNIKYDNGYIIEEKNEE